MTTDVIYEERGSDWSQQDLVVGRTRWLQRDQTLPLSAKGVACETKHRHLDSNVSEILQLDQSHCRNVSKNRLPETLCCWKVVLRIPLPSVCPILSETIQASWGRLPAGIMIQPCVLEPAWFRWHHYDFTCHVFPFWPSHDRINTLTWQKSS